jgi:hypothetical protein
MDRPAAPQGNGSAALGPPSNGDPGQRIGTGTAALMAEYDADMSAVAGYGGRGGRTAEQDVPLLPPGTPSRSRSPPSNASSPSIASLLRQAYSLLPQPILNLLGAIATLVRRNSRLTLLAVVLAFVLISAHYIREEVQDWYEDHYDRDDDGHEYHGKAGGPPKGWSAVPSLPSDGIKPGMLLVHPDQEATVRALILELMVRFNRITYKCENLVKLGGSGSQFKDEGMWPVCFDAPYWKSGRVGDHKRMDTGLDKLNEGAKGNCVQYTFGVDWDFRWADRVACLLESKLTFHFST